MILNDNYRFEFINQPMTKESMGYENEDLIGENVIHYIHPEDIELVKENLKKGFKMGKGRITIRFKHRDGHWVWLEVKGKTFRDHKQSKKALFIGRIVTKEKNLKDLYKWLGELLRIEKNLSVNLNKAEALKDEMEMCLDAALRVSKMDCGMIYLINHETKKLEVAAHHGIPRNKKHLVTDFRRFDLNRINCSIYTESSDLGEEFLDIHNKEGIKAIRIVPIFHQNERIGYLIVASHILEEFPKSSREGLEIISSHIETSIIDAKRKQKIRENQQRLKKSEERLKILNDTYLKFGNDPIQNIQHLVDAVGKILDADCALYNRIIERKGEKILKTLAIYNEPSNYQFEDNPIGHICYDLIKSNPDDVVVIDNLDQTKYVKTDINVKKYKLQIYCGSGVKLNDKTVAMFCVVYQSNTKISQADKNLIQILAESASIEEQRMHAKQKLQKSEEKYRLLFETMVQGVVYHEKDGHISSANPAAERILGLSRDKIHGRSSEHPEWKAFKASGRKFPGHEHPSRKALKTGKKVKNTLMKLYNPEKQNFRWININAVPLFQEGEKEAYRVYTTFEDVTEQRHAEEQLKEAVNRSDFYRDLLAHDIGNVLGNLNSSLQILEMLEKGEDISQNKDDIMEIMKKAITRGKNLISSVRKLSLIEKKTQSKTQINIKSILEKSIEHIQNHFQKKNLKISLKMEKNDFSVNAGDLLLDAFENILINGVLHNINERVKLWISVSKVVESGTDYIKLEFKDNGIGITDERKEKIFKKSYKKRKGSGGMGIGLSLVKKIIDSYEGRIWVEDRIFGDHQKGSNFIILLKEVK